MAAEICPVCGRGTLGAVVGTYETEFRDRQGQTQALKVPGTAWDECDQCGEVFLGDSANHRIETARREASGLLTPREIRDLRLSLHRTQMQMSEMLGVGEKTYCRWESGAYIQSAAFDRYLRLLIEVPQNVCVLQRLEAGEGVSKGVVEDEPTFTYLSNVDSLQARAETFTHQLECGQLYLAAVAAGTN